MISSKKVLQLVLTRPNEPMLVPKGGADQCVVFQMPDSFLIDRFRQIKTKINDQYKGIQSTPITINNVNIPDLSVPMLLGRNEQFTLFYPKHRKIAGKLIDIFMAQRNVQDLISLAAYCRDRLNPYLFNYAMSVALLHRKDTRDVTLPSQVELFPGKFIDSAVFGKARQESSMIPVDAREPINLARESTANSREPEQRLAYFREDIGINLHHWHWHLVFPFEATDRSIVAKDRRGELFYYMHQQLINRYNTERFANNLGYVKNLANLREPIAEGYFPKLDSKVASRAWPPRFANMILRDVDRPQDELKATVADIEKWDKTIRDAIAKGFVVDSNGRQVSLKDQSGIDILGNIIEASVLTSNSTLYGDIHNMVHVLIALVHDPDGRYNETFAVMGDTATAMRDPVFYRWHSYINDMFWTYKETLPKYTVDQLEFQNVTVTDVQILTDGKTPNQFNTFWEQSDIDMSRGLDFAPRSPVYVRFTHLQHDEFTYKIQVINSSQQQKVGYVRIFIAPVYNDAGKPMLFNEQRKIMIELDKFRTVLQKGQNIITRKSLDSSVTIPYERTFRSLDENRPTDPTLESSFNFCGCGWPHHMLIPKGTSNGMAFNLFVMVSNYETDGIVQDVTGICNDAASFCGIQDKLYPDKRPMGYPFDRLPRPGVQKLSDFLTPNMKVKDVTIKFTDRTTVRNTGAQCCTVLPVWRP